MMSLHPVFRCALAALAFVASSGMAYAQFNARVQAIHNAADPSLEVIDLYVSGQLVLDDIAFRTASPYLDIPALIPLTGGIAPGNSTGPGDVFFEFGFTLALNQTYQFILVGVRDPGLFLPNPDGRDISLDVVVNDQAQEAAVDPAMVDVLSVHGSPDAPMLDIVQGVIPGTPRGGPVVFGDNLAFNDISDYVSIDQSSFAVMVESTDGTTFSQLYEVIIANLGDAITLLTSGFLDPTGNQDGPEVALLVAFADGTTFVLMPVVVAIEGNESHPDAFSLRGNYPNPFNPSTTISFDLASPAGVSIEVFDVFGRRVLATGVSPYSAGVGHEFQVDASSLPSGTYLYRVLAELGGGVQIQTGRMTLVR